MSKITLGGYFDKKNVIIMTKSQDKIFLIIIIIY